MANGQSQNSGSITNPKNDRRTLTHRGSEVGTEKVTRSQNATGSFSRVLDWECPRKFERIDYAGGVHWTKAELRYVQSETLSDDDGSATLEESERTFTVNGNLQAVSGEEDLTEQPFPSVRVVNTTQGTEIPLEDLTVSYAQDTVTLPDESHGDVAIGDSVKLYPVVSEGLIQYRAIDQFGHEVASLDDWGTPVHAFADHNQMKQDSRIHLVGRVTWEESEKLAVYIKSDRTIVWEDADYPDSFVSSFAQKVDVSV